MARQWVVLRLESVPGPCDSSLIGKEIRRAGKSASQARSREGSYDTFQCPDLSYPGKALPSLLSCHFQTTILKHFTATPSSVSGPAGPGRCWCRCIRYVGIAKLNSLCPKHWELVWFGPSVVNHTFYIYSIKAKNVTEVSKKVCQVAVDIWETHLIHSDSLNHARPPFLVDSTVQLARVLFITLEQEETSSILASGAWSRLNQLIGMGVRPADKSNFGHTISPRKIR